MPVKSATLRMRLAAMAMRVLGLTGSRKRSFGSAQAKPALTPQSNAGGPQIHPLDAVIRGRAERVCNRDRALVQKYLEVQAILSRGRFSE